jgi:large subunit ribosomal protein L15
MKLNEISNNPGAHKRKARVGRGSSSGLGKTSGRGVKGAKARTGTKVYGFEGGQMPLYMRMPKRGFNNIFANDFAEVNLGRLQKAIDEKKIDASGRLRRKRSGKPASPAAAATASGCSARALITAKARYRSRGRVQGAIAAVEKAGGTVTTTFKKPVYMNKKGQPGKKAQRRAKSAEKKAARKPNNLARERLYSGHICGAGRRVSNKGRPGLGVE